VPVRTVTTDLAPAAIGPYSQGIVAGGFLFTAGQIGLDARSGNLIGADIVGQTEQVMANLTAVLQSVGAAWGDVVKTTVYLVDLNDFRIVNEIYGRVLGDARPARSTVQVAALPRGALVEVDLVATVRGS
jgi:2-iminobutanoate/2-iminopropanoate deaminase